MIIHRLKKIHTITKKLPTQHKIQFKGENQVIKKLSEGFLLVTTRNKMRLVKILSLTIQFIRRLLRLEISSLVVKRKGIFWKLDLSEAIDFNIYIASQYEKELAKKMQETLAPGSIVIDIGANIGGHTLPLAKMVGETGHVYAIEPTDFAFEKLTSNIDINPKIKNRITPFKLFLTDKDKKNIPVKVSASWSIQGGMSNPNRNQLDMGYGKSIKTATVKTLDELVDELNIKRIDAIKIDVDGHEVEILNGAANTLEKFSPILFIEFAPIHYEVLKTTFSEQVEILTRNGYVFEDVLGNRLPQEAKALLDYIPRGTLINVVARKKSLSEVRKSLNETKLKALKQTLTDYMSNQKTSWSYLKVMTPGYASKKLYAIYMIETYHYTFHNSRNQALISTRKEEIDINYMKFCLHHAADEAGHEMMAFNDIRKLGFNLHKENLPDPLPATQELINYLYSVAETGTPLARLGYSFWAERVYSYIAPLLSLMKVGIGIPSKSMTFFNEHSDIDAKHAVEIDEAIIRFAKTDEDWKAIEECMIGSLDRTIKMTHEVLSEYDKVRAKESTRYDFLFKDEL